MLLSGVVTYRDDYARERRLATVECEPIISPARCGSRRTDINAISVGISYLNIDRVFFMEQKYKKKCVQ